jgi:hypothetical protein
MELLVTYYEDGLPRVQHLLQAALAFRAGQDTIDAGSGPRAVELVIKEEAHALKGSAANVRLWRLAKVRTAGRGVRGRQGDEAMVCVSAPPA